MKYVILGMAMCTMLFSLTPARDASRFQLTLSAIWLCGFLILDAIDKRIKP